jgi:serpin B
MKYRILILAMIFLSTMRLVALQVEQIGSLTGFSFDLYNQLKSKNENLFFSPYSIEMALLMTREGARNDTKEAFEKVLHVDPAINTESVQKTIQELISCKDSSNQLKIENAIWIQNNFLLTSGYQKNIQTHYLADAFQVDFYDHSKSANQINTWVSQKTAQFIRKVISTDQISDSTRMVITNAVYFMGKWAKKFDSNLTRKNIFYGMNADNVKVNFLHETEKMDYFENNDFQMITKYYKGYDKSFCIILPKKKDGITSLEARMDKSLFDSIFNHVSIKEIDLFIPKIKLETSYTLNQSLSKLGLKIAFSDSADFSGISLKPNLKISSILHKAYIKIDEEKTEAAAVTSVKMDYFGSKPAPKPHPIIFNADHPFLFMILDSKTKSIDFMGRYVKAE